MVTDPTGRMVYGGSQYGIYAFTSDAVTGQLTYAIPARWLSKLRGYGVTATNCANPQYYGMAMHPSGQFLFAARSNGNKLDAYLVDGGNGGLTLAGTYGTGTAPRSVAVDPTGKFVYVGNQSSHTVTAYAVDAMTGALTTVTGSPFATVSNPMALVIEPSGKHLYVAGSSGALGAYTIESTTGALTPVSGSPYAATCCANNGSVAVDPTGRFLYVPE